MVLAVEEVEQEVPVLAGGSSAGGKWWKWNSIQHNGNTDILLRGEVQEEVWVRQLRAHGLGSGPLFYGGGGESSNFSRCGFSAWARALLLSDILL